MAIKIFPKNEFFSVVVFWRLCLFKLKKVKTSSDLMLMRLLIVIYFIYQLLPIPAISAEKNVHTLSCLMRILTLRKESFGNASLSEELTAQAINRIVNFKNSKVTRIDVAPGISGQSFVVHSLEVSSSNNAQKKYATHIEGIRDGLVRIRDGDEGIILGKLINGEKDILHFLENINQNRARFLNDIRPIDSDFIQNETNTFIDQFKKALKSSPSERGEWTHFFDQTQIRSEAIKAVMDTKRSLAEKLIGAEIQKNYAVANETFFERLIFKSSIRNHPRRKEIKENKYRTVWVSIDVLIHLNNTQPEMVIVGRSALKKPTFPPRPRKEKETPDTPRGMIPIRIEK